MLAYEQLRESVLGRNTDGGFPLWYEAHINAFFLYFCLSHCSPLSTVCVQESSGRGNAGRCCGPVSGEPDGPGEGADADGRQAHPGGEGAKVKANSTSGDRQSGRHSDKRWHGSISQHNVNSRRQGQANYSPFHTQTGQPNALYIR